MEYVQGDNLYRVVQARGPLPASEACRCIRQAALGLDHAHKAGVVHRDITAGNLLLTPDGVVKVADKRWPMAWADLGCQRAILHWGRASCNSATPTPVTF